MGDSGLSQSVSGDQQLHFVVEDEEVPFMFGVEAHLGAGLDADVMDSVGWLDRDGAVAFTVG